MTSSKRPATPKASYIEVKNLKLDLKNFRTIPQANEDDAVHAMITIKPEYFYGLLNSLIEDGYVPIENIVVLDNGQHLVKEGNRRIACMKLIHGILNPASFNLPPTLLTKIAAVDRIWKTENAKVPCLVYDLTRVDDVDRIVTKTHGKGEKASRNNWNSVATARHARDMKSASEPALDLLEKYFTHGKNITANQKETWAGDYPLTVLSEAMAKLSTRLGLKNAIDLASTYPKIPHRDGVEKILSNIGGETIGFKEIRDKDDDYAVRFGGLPPIIPTSSSATTTTSSATTTAAAGATSGGTGTSGGSTTTSGTSGTTGSGGTTGSTSSGGSSSGGPAGATATTAFAVSDHRGVTKTLKAFFPSGLNRGKVVTLRDEAVALNLPKNPIAFCFLLRSLFEISVKMYFKDNTIALVKTGGKDKTLKEMLEEAKKHIIAKGVTAQMSKDLHGASVELGKTNGILSVTSLNQLVHHPTFVVTDKDISSLFSNIFPLLKALN